MYQTWSYETDATHPYFPVYNSDQREMHIRARDCYKLASRLIDAPIIPVGDVIQHLRENTPEFDYKNGGRSLCRDGFHMDIPYGRYALAAIWYETLMGGDVSKNPYLPPEADPALIAVIKEEIHRYLAADQR